MARRIFWPVSPTRDYVGELKVHLRQRLLQMLHIPALVLQEHAALTPQRTQSTNRIGRTKGAAEQTVGHQLLQPLAVEYVGLAPRDVLDVTRIDQENS